MWRVPAPLRAPCHEAYTKAAHRVYLLREARGAIYAGADPRGARGRAREPLLTACLLFRSFLEAEPLPRRSFGAGRATLCARGDAGVRWALTATRTKARSFRAGSKCADLLRVSHTTFRGRRATESTDRTFYIRNRRQTSWDGTHECELNRRFLALTVLCPRKPYRLLGSDDIRHLRPCFRRLRSLIRSCNSRK